MMLWWVWVLAGLGLLGVEVLTPGGFFVLFFGLAALVVGLLVAIGAGGPAWAQWLTFSVLSVASVVLFRRRLVEYFRSGQGREVGVETLVGETAILHDDLAPGGVGKGELRGTVWNVRSHEGRRLARGARVRVESVEGLTLWVRAE
jgi:membrane protein implicated in regulation of membrane protease activity